MLQFRQLGIQLLEDAFLAVFDLVLRLARAQRLGQVVPIFEQPRVEHYQNPADVARAVLVQIDRAGGRVEIARRRTVAIAIEEFHSDQRVKEVLDAARVQAEFRAQLGAGHTAVAEPGEHAELDGGEENFGRPESKSRLENGTGIELRLGVKHRF